VIPRPTRRGLGVLSVLVGLVVLAIVNDTPELVPLIVAVGLPSVVAPVSAAVRGRRARTGLVVSTLVSPPMSAVGGDVTLEIRVTNRTSRPAPVVSITPTPAQWHPRRPGSLTGPSAAGTTSTPPPALIVPRRLVTLPAPGPRSSAAVTSPVPSGRRGVFTLAPPRGWVLDPFGLWAAPGPAVATATVVLHPEPDPSAQWPTPTGTPLPEGTNVVIGAPGREGPGELVGLRPYQAGDRLSLVHWSSRARYGTWFVRQFAPDVGSEPRLILDDRAGVHRQSEFEEMLCTAESLVELCWRDGRTIELRTLSGSSTRLSPVPLALEQAQVLLATVLPRMTTTVPDAGGGPVLTTVTGARTLPDRVDRIVVGA
jgi:Protein of unknown function DUF58